MSKIQKALGKIRKSENGSGEVPGTSQSMDDTTQLARLVNHDSVDHSGSVSNKCLHVDAEALSEAGLIAPEYHRDMLANQYRDIKRPLIAHAFGKRAMQIENGNLIMVSSALSGEGKTFTSINLALSMARERDHSVLLVDADVAKPHTSNMFGAKDELGLLDFLENPSIPVRSLILPTDIESLSLLPAGRPRANATELLASAAMDDLCDMLKNLNPGQIVIFDSPPLLQTSEAKVLASLAGQVVLVVRAEETAQDAVKGALATLDEEKAVNLVLNQARKGFGEHGYGYGYGYGFDRKPKASADSTSKASSEIASEGSLLE